MRQVAGTDEKHVHAFHGDQFFQVIDRLHLFQHQTDQGVTVGFSNVVGGGPGKSVTGGSAAAENAPMTFGVILDRIYGGLRFGGSVDVRHLYAPGSPVKKRSDNLRFVAHRPYNGCDAA